jgi:hypothetical protein
MTKQDFQGGRTYAMPVVWILVLLVSYLVLSDWDAVPRLISTTLAAIG